MGVVVVVAVVVVLVGLVVHQPAYLTYMCIKPDRTGAFRKKEVVGLLRQIEGASGFVQRS